MYIKNKTSRGSIVKVLVSGLDGTFTELFEVYTSIGQIFIAEGHFIKQPYAWLSNPLVIFFAVKDSIYASFTSLGIASEKMY